MKKYFNQLLAVCSLTFLLLTSFAFVDTKEDTEETISELTKEKDQEEFKDCTFTIKGNYDGLEVDVEITVYDITWVECASLKLAVAALQ